ncbi:MAG: hypothetical protein [Bacteriophage sp.]|nr:MAG: hypothetical protein [Bacteriophage sp.]
MEVQNHFIDIINSDAIRIVEEYFDRRQIEIEEQHRPDEEDCFDLLKDFVVQIKNTDSLVQFSGINDIKALFDTFFKDPFLKEFILTGAIELSFRLSQEASNHLIKRIAAAVYVGYNSPFIPDLKSVTLADIENWLYKHYWLVFCWVVKFSNFFKAGKNETAPNV